MAGILHGSAARTTPRVRAKLQASTESTRALAEHYGLNTIPTLTRSALFTSVEAHEKAGKMNGAVFPRNAIQAFPYKIHTVLTDNGMAFVDPPKNRTGPTAMCFGHIFDRVCRENGIEHLLAVVTAYNFAKHLKALCWRTPFQAICNAWTNDPSIFRINPHHLIPGPHTHHVPMSDTLRDLVLRAAAPERQGGRNACPARRVRACTDRFRSARLGIRYRPLASGQRAGTPAGGGMSAVTPIDRRENMTLTRVFRMSIGAGIGSLVGLVSILPLYLFIASLGIAPIGLWRNVVILALLCSPLIFVGAVSERHEGVDQPSWLRRIIPFCLGTAVAGAVLCAAPAYVAYEAKVDASIVYFLAFGWLSGMQGAFFIQLSRGAFRSPDDDAGLGF